MNIGQTEEAIALSVDQRWLATKHGQDIATPISLDTAAWTAHASVIEKTTRPGTNGTVPDGVAVSTRDADGMGVPAGTAASTPAGVLLEPLSLPLDTTEAAVGALYWHGRVVISKLPANNGADATFRDALPLIRWDA